MRECTKIRQNRLKLITSGLLNACKNSDLAPLLLRFELVAALWVVGNVEGVIGGRLVGSLPPSMTNV